MSLNVSAQKYMASIKFSWGQLATIPDQHGFAGSFAGTSYGALIVAGGANFPDGGAPWSGSQKAWTDQIFVLEKASGVWKRAGHLPQPMGYGVSVSYGNKLICIGGSNADGHLASVFAFSYQHGKIITAELPALPHPLANACGALIGNTIYIAGGLFTPDARSTADIFWSLDLSNAHANWQTLATWPGPPRMLAAAAAYNNSFYLFSGTDLEDNNGVAHRKYLTDAYCFTPAKGWKKLADMPMATVAAPTLIPALTPNKLYIFGGDDGRLADNAASLKEKHPGFSDHVLVYDIAKNIWLDQLRIKTSKKPDAASNPNGSVWAPVTTTSVFWHGMLVFPGGEVRPAVRTPRVLTLTVK